MQITKEIIDRYHLGQCSQEEQHSVEQWLASDEVEMSFPGQVDVKTLEDKSWKKFSGRYPMAVQPIDNRTFKLITYRKLLKLVACVILIIGAALGYYLNLGWENGENQMLVYKEVKTRKGEKLSVTLSDGTVVWLNSESMLRFPVSFKGGVRELKFTGEAYFSVAKDPLKPFVIHTAKTKIQVLGTKFNLRALTSETTTSVVVAEGKVKFMGDLGKPQIILTINKRGIFETTGSSAPTMKIENVYAEKYSAWKNNELVMDNLTMEKAVLALEGWYNVKIKINRQELTEERYTGSFNNPTLKQVLESMAYTVKFRYKQQGQTFILY